MTNQPITFESVAGGGLARGRAHYLARRGDQQARVVLDQVDAAYLALTVQTVREQQQAQEAARTERHDVEHLAYMREVWARIHATPTTNDAA